MNEFESTQFRVMKQRQMMIIDEMEPETRPRALKLLQQSKKKKMKKKVTVTTRAIERNGHEAIGLLSLLANVNKNQSGLFSLFQISQL